MTLAAADVSECTYPAIYPAEEASTRLLHDPRNGGEVCARSKFSFNSTAVDRCVVNETSIVRLDDERSANVFDVKVRRRDAPAGPATANAVQEDCWSLRASGKGPVMVEKGLQEGVDYLVTSISGTSQELVLRMSTAGADAEDTKVTLEVSSTALEGVACACVVVEQSSSTSSCRLDSPALDRLELLYEIAKTVSRRGDRVQRDPLVAKELGAEGIYVSRVVSFDNAVEVTAEFVDPNPDYCEQWKDALERKGSSMGWSSIRMVADSLTMEWVTTEVPTASQSDPGVPWYLPVAVVVPVVVLATAAFLWRCRQPSNEAPGTGPAERQTADVHSSEPTHTKPDQELVRVVPTPSLARYARRGESGPLRQQAGASPTAGSGSQGGLPLVPGPGWESTFDATEVNETLHSGTGRGSLAYQRAGSSTVVPPPCPTPQYKRREAPTYAAEYGSKQDRLEHWVETQKKEPSEEDAASEYTQ